MARASLTKGQRAGIQRHYEAALPLLLKHFGGMPILRVAFPLGLGERATYRALPADLPAEVGTLEIVTGSGAIDL